MYDTEAQQALAHMAKTLPETKSIIDRLVSSSSANSIEYQNKVQVILEILEKRNMDISSIDLSNTDILLEIVMGAVISMDQELEIKRLNPPDLDLGINPFDSDDTHLSLEIERKEIEFKSKLDILKHHEVKGLFSSSLYWSNLQKIDRWIQSNILLEHASANEYEPNSAWIQMAESYGKKQ
jgi:hypothetical protein